MTDLKNQNYINPSDIVELFNKISKSLELKDLDSANDHYYALLRAAKQYPGAMYKALEDMKVTPFMLARIMTEHLLRQHEEEWDAYLNWDYNLITDYPENSEEEEDFLDEDEDECDNEDTDEDEQEELNQQIFIKNLQIINCSL